MFHRCQKDYLFETRSCGKQQKKSEARRAGDFTFWQCLFKDDAHGINKDYGYECEGAALLTNCLVKVTVS